VQSYWNNVEDMSGVCGSSDYDNANANSETCGNCDGFLGSRCASALENNADVEYGDYYCKDLSCEFDGEPYRNGESWCVYDGSIGNGTDVVGSRHWRYSCSDGEVDSWTEPCADARNQICVQSNAVGENGEVFRTASCAANNWRKCIDLNSDEDGLEACEETLNCRIDKVSIADYFSFDVCLPKYPGGADFTDERFGKTGEIECAMASQTCTVIYEPEGLFGESCGIAANKGCTKAGFAREMNEFCMGQGLKELVIVLIIL